MENTDFINRLDIYWQVNLPNFIGILKDYDLSNLDDNLIEILIDKRVYVIREVYQFPDLIEEYDEDREKYNAFGWFIARKPFYYDFNPLIVKESFLLIRNYIENKSYITEDFVLALEFKVDSKFDRKSKKKYLKKQYEKFLPDDLEFASFSTLVDKSEKVYGVHQAWYESFTDLVGSDSESFLGLYLTNSKGDLTLEKFIKDMVALAIEVDHEFKDFVEQWKTFYKAELILNEILFLLEEIDNENRVLVDKKNKESEITLKDLFNNVENYEPFIKLYIKKNIIKNTVNGHEIIYPKKFTKKRNFFNVALAMYLMRKDYMKIYSTDKEIVSAMNNTFSNCNLSKQNYSSFKDSPKQTDYFKAIDKLIIT
ncbi:hypothetical protein [Psychroserpens luteus]|uniref:Uncharacterized protein n=1 Tax=Psychroserpens luteus TaxID=1434066 RepID=A0ABW5ZTF1_9FLAO|nr:hypothetical protein [Psychroserpens luteus]